MSASDEYQAFLRAFDGLYPIPVTSASVAVFGSACHRKADAHVRQAVQAGHLVRVAGVDGKVFSWDMELTDAGRIACGLPVVEAKPKPRALFD